MSLPTALVFDNYQDVPEDSEFHNVIKDGLKLVPEGMRILIASRKESPPPFVSLKTDRLLAYLGWQDLRFTPNEVRSMVEQKQKGPVSEEIAQHVHEETQGWAAAVILMMDEEKMPAVTAIGQSSVFNYFAMEVFPKFDQRMRDYLCITALLPEVSPEISAELTGIEESDAILAYLSRNQYFIARYGKEYRYHPLFREFLLDQAKKNYDTDKLVSAKIRAARLLVRSGRIEEAVRLLFEAKAYIEALPVILNHAQMLLSQGRSATLEEWAESLPDNIREANPWFSYWLGMGRILLDPRKSAAMLEKAFHLFESEKNNVGCLLAASGIVNSLMLRWDEYKSLDPWIDWIDSNAPVNKPLPTPELEAQIASAMVLGLTWRRPWHPNMATWIERAMSASKETEDISIRCTARAHVIENYGFLGHWKEMRLVAEELRQLTFSSHASPLVHLAYLFRVIETHDFLRASWEDAFKRLQSAIKLAEQIGAHAHFGFIYMHGVWIAFEMENLQMASDFLKKMERTPFVGGGVGSAFYHDLSAVYHLQIADLATSYRDAMEGLRASIEASVPIVETWCRITLAYVLRRLGKRDEASEQIEEAEKIITPCGLTHELYLIYLVRASLALDKGDKPMAAAALRKAFYIGKEKGYGITLFRYWQPDEMARLCAEALTSDIEEEYARELITRHHLVPTGGRPEDLGEWPWPCCIRTFGGFEVTIDDSPSSLEGRKRPLDLLKVLISLGGDEVCQETIEDELWPEAEGDMARISFKTNLSRLRKVIGEKTIEVKDGKVSLNPQCVWLDLWALESLANKVSELYRKRNQSKSPDEPERLAHLVFDIYRGDFLATDNDPRLNAARERLRTRSAKMLERLAQMLIETTGREKAVLMYEKAMEMGIPVNAIQGLSPSQIRNHP
jgi:LuxR family maltose regulon positive regulatory protein